MIPILKKQLNLEKKKQFTLLGAGPVSRNVIIACSKISKKKNIPIMMVASRRQIETKKLSPGYVDNLNTEKYSKLVNRLDSKNLILCRDHGGPYQGSEEELLSKKIAMQRAKTSIKADIDNNFKIIHIDPSISPNRKIIPKKKIIDDTIHLIDFAYSYSNKHKKKIYFEIGTEEPSCFTDTPEKLDNLIFEILKTLKKENLPKPLFCVLQTGTRVKEFSNIGDLNNIKLIKKNINKINKIVKICNTKGIFFKQHNTDYLNVNVLREIPRLSINAANIAPEFGHVESISLLNLLREHKLKNHSEKFLELSYKSNKWKKWLNKNSKLNDMQKSLLAGHYIFANKDFKDLKRKIQIDLPSKINLDQFLVSKIEKKILFYLRLFKII